MLVDTSFQEAVWQYIARAIKMFILFDPTHFWESVLRTFSKWLIQRQCSNMKCLWCNHKQIWKNWPRYWPEIIVVVLQKCIYCRFFLSFSDFTWWYIDFTLLCHSGLITCRNSMLRGQIVDESLIKGLFSLSKSFPRLVSATLKWLSQQVLNTYLLSSEAGRLSST